MNRDLFFKYCFGIAPSILPEAVILSPVFPLKKFAEYCKEIMSFRGRLYRGMKALKNGREFAVIYSGVGSALAGDAVLAMESAPVGKIIFTGVSGAFGDSEIGDIIVCEEAFNGEGFTQYHGRKFSMDDIFSRGELISSNKAYTRALKDFFYNHLEDKSILKSGKLFTIGSLTAEKVENLADIEKRGYIGIEMELSAVYHAAGITRQAAAALTVVSDLPIKKPLGENLTSEEKKRYNSGIEKLISLSVEFAVS